MKIKSRQARNPDSSNRFADKSSEKVSTLRDFLQ